MSLILTPNDVGCYIDGHWGIYATGRALEIFEGLGWQPPADVNAPNGWTHPDTLDTIGTDTLIELEEEARDYINGSGILAGVFFEWEDGELYLASIPTDDDDAPAEGIERPTFRTLTVCADCIMVAANGAGETTPEHAAAYTNATNRHRTELIPTCGDPTCTRESDTYGPGRWFSWQPCEWCGDTKGGDRMHAAIPTE